MPTKKEDLPSTIARSPKKVQRTYGETLDSAHEQYDSEERAHRTAYSAVKHVAEKRGDRWELDDDAKQAGIEGRSKMSKDELAEALRKHNDRETARARR
jgi:cation transport regulator ChaB